MFSLMSFKSKVGMPYMGRFFCEFLGISLDVTLVDEQNLPQVIVILSSLHFAHRDFLRIFRLLLDS